ncbi:MAG: IS200/IS605 family transposase [Dehalococcoidia bacterium]|nr:IS200/IS605 family transposase [Dehalococcoidia bacterium]
MTGHPTEVGATGAANLASDSIGRSGERRSVAVHYNFSTHNRRQVFEVEEFRVLIEKLLLQIAAEKDLEVIALKVLADHVHLLIRKDTRRSDAEVMQSLKGVSAWYFFLQYPDVKEDLGSQSLWTHGYYSRFVSRGDVPRVVQYIKQQRDSQGTDKRYHDGLTLERPPSR